MVEVGRCVRDVSVWWIIVRLVETDAEVYTLVWWKAGKVIENVRGVVYVWMKRS